ncbi:MAG: class I SAM-dependent methyltransferase [Cytophagales bacterium]|nr:MAG: class I SAM-dependent methyltransferase [Cytophagales bacterium]
MKNWHQLYKQQQFLPLWWSIFINPFFIVRRGLYLNIKKYAPLLQGKLLDFGCGRKPYQDLFQVEEYIGLDTEQSGHPHEGEERSQIDVFYDGNTIPLPEESFDAVFSSEVFEHVFELEHSLSEINRILKPKGKLLFTTPFVWDEHEIPYDFGRYSQYGLKHILEKKGFTVINISKSGHFITTLTQLQALYVFHLLRTPNKYLNIVLCTLFITPILCIGILIGAIFPKIRSLYLNTIVLAEKN